MSWRSIEPPGPGGAPFASRLVAEGAGAAGSATPAGGLISRATISSAMNWSRLRSPPSPRPKSAQRRKAKKAPIPGPSGSSTEDRNMVSGAGRMDTRRSATAPRILASTAAGSNRPAIPAAAWRLRASPTHLPV